MLNVHYGVHIEDDVITVTMVFPDSNDPSNADKGFEVSRFQIPIIGWQAINTMIESILNDDTEEEPGETSTIVADNILKLAFGENFGKDNPTP